MRIGILGAGEMGRMHAEVYRDIPEVQIAGIISRSEGRAQRLAGELGVPAATDPRVLLEDDTVDAIDMTYPSGAHGEWVVAALERGKHVFCETPMALTLEDADAMIDAAGRYGRHLMVAQLMRFVDEWAFIRDAVRSGTIGKPIAAATSRRTPPYGVGQGRDVALYGEPIVELLIFDFDYLIWLLGSPVSIVGSGIIGASGVFEHATCLLDFGDAQAVVEGSALMPPSFPFTTSLRVLGEDGALEVAGALSKSPIPNIGVVHYPREGAAEVLEVPAWDPYEAECRHFVRCVKGEADPAPLDAPSAREALRVALAAREAVLHRGLAP